MAQRNGTARSATASARGIKSESLLLCSLGLEIAAAMSGDCASRFGETVAARGRALRRTSAPRHQRCHDGRVLFLKRTPEVISAIMPGPQGRYIYIL